jgi:hypothetical protein
MANRKQLVQARRSGAAAFWTVLAIMLTMVVSMSAYLGYTIHQLNTDPAQLERLLGESQRGYGETGR